MAEVFCLQILSNKETLCKSVFVLILLESDFGSGSGFSSESAWVVKMHSKLKKGNTAWTIMEPLTLVKDKSLNIGGCQHTQK